MIYLRIALIYIVAVPFFFLEFLREQKNAISMANLGSFAIANSSRKRLIAKSNPTPTNEKGKEA